MRLIAINTSPISTTWCSNSNVMILKAFVQCTEAFFVIEEAALYSQTLSSLMKLSVIIVNYNVKYFLEVCLHSVIRAIEGIDAEVIVVDNNSTDGSVAWIADKFPQIKLIANKDNKGFSKANNQAAAIAQGEYVLFLNPDTVVPEEFFTETLAYMDAHPEAGALGPRQIDGKGVYAIGSKKSFPSFWTAVFKTTGLGRLFPKSKTFNRYFAVHIGEYEQAPIEVLHGCCMLVRKKAMDEAGGAFDEDYFMYCEDVDLSYRIIKAGYENIYYPGVTMIHYKGESTRKASLRYIRIFNHALATFVRKHYSSAHARVFLFLINIGIVFRAFFAILKNSIRLLRLPLLDAIILLLTLWIVKDVWMSKIRDINPIPFKMALITFPIYTGIWLLSLFLNGAYDEPYRPGRVIRGMLIGTVLGLAFLGLLPAELRYSRAVIVLTGFIVTAIMIGLHGLLYRMGIIGKATFNNLPRKAIIVSDEEHYRSTVNTLNHVPAPPEVVGRVAYSNSDAHNALDVIDNLDKVLYATAAQEVIFCVNGISYHTILAYMMQCGKQYEYKIHLPGSRSFVGSNSENTSGDLYTVDHRYNLSSFEHRRNKRVLDISLSIMFLLLYPFMALGVKAAGNFLQNIFKVLWGKRTWVGYSNKNMLHGLPPIQQGVIPVSSVQQDYQPGEEITKELDMAYAKSYTPATDIALLKKNWKFLGEK